VRRRSLPAILLVLILHSGAPADVTDSKHNLSTSGPGQVTAASESRVCIFCHTSHHAAAAGPLWNHESTPVGSYSTYSSSTLEVTGPIRQPSGASKLCLSCHDGTVALGQTVTEGLIDILNAGQGGRMGASSSDLGTDLTDDHPISFRRNPSDQAVVNPPPGGAVKLDPGGEIQCTSCHDPHEEDRDPVSRRFLVKSNRGSAICLSCHRQEYWNGSGHESAAAPYTAAQGAHTGYNTVRDNGCESCHRPHSGQQPQRLLKATEEETCMPCHDGSVASTDIASEFSKPHVHPTFSLTPSAHDAAESPISTSASLPEMSPAAPRHAECQDCHNPHSGPSAAAPGLPGAIAGAWGIGPGGQERRPITAEYQLCYKCHADSANVPQAMGRASPPPTPRKIRQFNVRVEFDPLNPSHHAVEAPGKNADVPSLLSPYHTGSTIRCTDCHNSDSGAAGGGGPRGPHGSIYPALLERRLVGGSRNPGSDFMSLYALCFKCHSDSSILGDETFSKHRLHIEQEGASCLVCHDPHGVSATQGSATGSSHLINFDTGVVLPNGRGELRFEDLGDRTGACYLTCHGRTHDPETY
jgi:predicted CXXCH cytochrome family protein